MSGPMLLVRLARDPGWLAGWLTNICGFGVQAVALYLGSVAVVQPLIVTQLLFALPLGTVGTGRRLPTKAWLAAGAVCAGLVILLAVRGAPPTRATLDDDRLLVAMAVAVVTAAVLSLVCLGRGATIRAALFGVGAGLFFALSAVLVKRTGGLLVDDGALATATAWYGYALCGATLGSMVLGQSAFAAGPFAPAVTSMNITNPVVSYLLAVFVYGVAPPAGTGRLAGVLAAGSLIAFGVVGLARVLSARRPVPAPTDLA